METQETWINLTVAAGYFTPDSGALWGNVPFSSFFCCPGPNRDLLLSTLKEEPFQNGRASTVFSMGENEYLLFSLPPGCANALYQNSVRLLVLPTSLLESALSQTKYALKLEHDFYEMLEYIYDDFTVINKDGVIEKALPHFEAMYGIPVKDVLGTSIYELERKKIFSPCVSARVFRSKKPETMLQFTPTGKCLMCTCIPIFDEQGALQKVISYTRDGEKYETLRLEYDNLQSTVASYSVQLEQLREKLKKESKLIGSSAQMMQITATATKIAQFDATVFITGESGVGKSLLADMIHTDSKRKDAPFISINCGAIPEHLLESELFGYEKGAFTGAGREGKAGLMELAHGGTLFLDEICDLPLHMQVKLLKVIQEKKVTRVGGIKEKAIDFRLVAATNRDVAKMIANGTFREDLYYRLNVLSINIPPLRERHADIFPLVNHFTQKCCRKYELQHAFSGGAIDCLERYDWPGNIRELENVVERMILTAEEYLITEELLPYYIYSASNAHDYVKERKSKKLKNILEEVEQQILLDAYREYGTTTRVAKELGISQASVSLKLNKYRKEKTEEA